MRSILSNLAKQLKADGVPKVDGFLKEAFEQPANKDESPLMSTADFHDISLREMFEAVVSDGREALAELDRGVNIWENEAIGTGNFNVIMSNLVLAEIKEGYMSEDYVFTNMIPTKPARFRDGEIIAAASGLGDVAQVVKEADPYPYVGLTDDWIRVPAPKNRGFIVPVTKQALFFDQTGTVLEQARKVGESMGLNKEKRLIDAFIDENTTAHRYRRRDRAAIASYGDNSGDHDFDNLEGSNTLADWSDLDNAEQLANAIIDPMTGEPIVVELTDLVVAKQLEQTARRIISATQIRYTASGAATETVAENPYRNKYNIVTSRLLSARMATDTHWFLGNIRKTVVYMQAWPITVTQAAENSEAAFERDIVTRFKASEMGAAAVREPRNTIKNT